MNNKPLMKCGHVANATTRDGQPCCAICNTPDAHIIAGHANPLCEREARCTYCGKKVPSKESLPFFKYRPAREYDEYYCGCRGWD